MNIKPNHFNRREYTPTIKSLAKNNRQNATDAERKMWHFLNNYKDHKFRRQFQINNKYNEVLGNFDGCLQVIYDELTTKKDDSAP